MMLRMTALHWPLPCGYSCLPHSIWVCLNKRVKYVRHKSGPSIWKIYIVVTALFMDRSVNKSLKRLFLTAVVWTPNESPQFATKAEFAYNSKNTFTFYLSFSKLQFVSWIYPVWPIYAPVWNRLIITQHWDFDEHYINLRRERDLKFNFIVVQWTLMVLIAAVIAVVSTRPFADDVVSDRIWKMSLYLTIDRSVP